MGVEICDEADAYEALERLRWAGGPRVCPKCGTGGRCYFLAPADGRSRRTRSGHATHRRIWKCGACRRQFSVLTGTILEGTKLRLRSWIEAVDALARSATVSDPAAGLSREAARHLSRLLEAATEFEPARSCLTELRR